MLHDEICAAGTKFSPYIVYSIMISLHSVLNYFLHIIVVSICFHYKDILVKEYRKKVGFLLIEGKIFTGKLLLYHIGI